MGSLALVGALSDCALGKWRSRFDLEYNQTVVLDTKEAKLTTPGILATHCIPSAMSQNLEKAVRGSKA